MSGLRQKKEDEKAEKSKASEAAAELGQQVIDGGGTQKTTVPVESLRKAVKKAEQKRKASRGKDVEKGTVRMESAKGKGVKAGWAKTAVIEVGGLTVTIEVNDKKGLLRFRTGQ